jgi:hypothetical protein
MKFFRLPAGLRWTWANFLVILIAMTAYRLLLVKIFALGSTPVASVIAKGLVMDLGALSIFALIFIFATWFHRLHPYRSRRGKYLSLGYFLFVAFLLAFIYGFDLVFIKTFGQRIIGTEFMAVFNDYTQAVALRANFPMVPFFVANLVMLWVWWLLLERLYNFLGSMDRPEHKVYRYTWQVIAMVLHLAFIFISINIIAGYNPMEFIIGKSPDTALADNPVLSLFFR